jgi:hypothetical protein
LPVFTRGGSGAIRFSENERSAIERRFARRRTHAAGELREVVGRVERRRGRLQIVLVDVIVPVRDQVAERTARVAKRDAAIHATRALALQRFLDDRKLELAIITDALRGRALIGIYSFELEEACYFSHGSWTC